MPSESSAALIWWAKLTLGEQRMWRSEAQSADPLVIYQLYWSRGPEITQAELAMMSKGNCPVCHHRGFVIGPQGGAATNVECADVTCRARFNVTWYSGEALIGHHLGNGATGTPWPSGARGARSDTVNSEPVDLAAVRELLEKWSEAAAAAAAAIDELGRDGARLLAKHDFSEQELSRLSSELAAVARAARQARDAVDTERKQP